MKLLDSIFYKLGRGLDHVGGALNKLISSEVVYKGEPLNPPAPLPIKQPIVPVPVPKDKPKSNVNVANVLAAISHNETRGVKGDPYAFSQPSGSSTMGKAIGKYQTTEGELKSWAKEFMGKEVDPVEFHKNPKLQDEYTTKKVETLLSAGASIEEILAMHRGGLTGYADPKKRQKKLAERKNYVSEAMEFYNSLGDKPPLQI